MFHCVLCGLCRLSVSDSDCVGFSVSDSDSLSISSVVFGLASVSVSYSDWPTKMMSIYYAKKHKQSILLMLESINVSIKKSPTAEQSGIIAFKLRKL